MTVIVSDSYERTVTGGLGAPDQGPAYALGQSAVNWNVANGIATADFAGNNTDRSFSHAGAWLNVDETLTFAWDKIEFGGALTTYLQARRVDGLNLYRVRAQINSNGSVGLDLQKAVNNVSSSLGGILNAAIPAGGYTAGAFLKMRYQVLGASPTVFKTKLWLASAPEPGAWMIGETTPITDNEPAFQVANTIGVHHRVGSGTTTDGTATGPWQVRWDNWIAQDLATQIARPSATQQAGGWTAVGAASLHAATSDLLDTTYITGTAS